MWGSLLRHLDPKTVMVLGLLAALGGAILFGASEFKAWATRDWSTAQGRVIASSIQPPANGRRSFYPRVRYRYQVSGRSFESTRIWLASEHGFDREQQAEYFLRAYAAGAPVAVHYNPIDPAEAALAIDDTDPTGIVVGLMGLMFAGAGWIKARNAAQRRA